MPISSELQKERVEATQEMAAALLEDLQHTREITSQLDPERGALRRLSGILSRILLERDLSNVAAPRTARVHIRCPDNKEFYRHTRKRNLPLFCSGGATAFGVFQRALIVNEGSKPLSIPGLDMEATVDLRVDNFVQQDVLCLNGQWANRQDVILYIRHVGFGVHSGKPTERQAAKFSIVQKIRHCVHMAKTTVPETGEPAASISVNMAAVAGNDQKFSYQPAGIDPVLFELLCMGNFVCSSPDVLSLEASIRQELGIPDPTPS